MNFCEAIVRLVLACVAVELVSELTADKVAKRLAGEEVAHG